MVAHSGEEIGSWVAFDSESCTECCQRQAASARPDPMSRLSEDRPVKVTYMETPVMSSKEPLCSLQVSRLPSGERRRMRQEKSHSLIQGLFALAFCILSTFFICTVAAFFGFYNGKDNSGLVASQMKTLRPVDSCEKMTKERPHVLRTTRVKGN